MTDIDSKRAITKCSYRAGLSALLNFLSLSMLHNRLLIIHTLYNNAR